MSNSITYSFLEIVCGITGPGGVINMANGAGPADEGITIDPSGDKNTMLIGADGSGMHSLSADKSGRVTARYLKTSPTNAFLSAMYAFQTASGATHGQNTITLVDKNRGDVITMQQCAFTKAPSIGYGKDGGMLEWEWHAVTIDRTLGGI